MVSSNNQRLMTKRIKMEQNKCGANHLTASLLLRLLLHPYLARLQLADKEAQVWQTMERKNAPCPRFKYRLNSNTVSELPI